MYITNNYAKKTIGMNIMKNDLYKKKKIFLKLGKKMEASSIDCDYVGSGTWEIEADDLRNG